jgi:hypothetical protein
MAEKQKNVITVNEVEYNVDDMTDKQKTMLAHVQDLERKINTTRFNLDQLIVGREAFAVDLANDLKNPKTENQEEAA